MGKHGLHRMQAVLFPKNPGEGFAGQGGLYGKEKKSGRAGK